MVAQSTQGTRPGNGRQSPAWRERDDPRPLTRSTRSRSPDMPTARVADDLEMHYLIDDCTDPWSEPQTVLLLHGSSESGAVWFGWVPHLARHFRVVRPDMRGFGASTAMPRDYPWPIDTVID